MMGNTFTPNGAQMEKNSFEYQRVVERDLEKSMRKFMMMSLEKYLTEIERVVRFEG